MGMRPQTNRIDPDGSGFQPTDGTTTARRADLGRDARRHPRCSRLALVLTVGLLALCSRCNVPHQLRFQHSCSQNKNDIYTKYNCSVQVFPLNGATQTDLTRIRFAFARLPPSVCLPSRAVVTKKTTTFRRLLRRVPFSQETNWSRYPPYVTSFDVYVPPQKKCSHDTFAIHLDSTPSEKPPHGSAKSLSVTFEGQSQS